MSRELSSPITSVDMTDKYDIRVCFDDRIIFDLGNWNELEYKITLAETVIDRLGIDKTGYLTMIGNNQCAFRDSSLVDDMDPIKSTVTTTATDTTSDTDTQTTTTATTAAATTETTEESAEEETTAAENP
jgi:hypothetical protein